MLHTTNMHVVQASPAVFVLIGQIAGIAKYFINPGRWLPLATHYRADLVWRLLNLYFIFSWYNMYEHCRFLTKIGDGSPTQNTMHCSIIFKWPRVCLPLAWWYMVGCMGLILGTSMLYVALSVLLPFTQKRTTIQRLKWRCKQILVQIHTAIAKSAEF